MLENSLMIVPLSMANVAAGQQQDWKPAPAALLVQQQQHQSSSPRLIDAETKLFTGIAASTHLDQRCLRFVLRQYKGTTVQFGVHAIY